MLQVTGLSKSFGGVCALQEASFSLQEGTVTGMVGPNGAGKSTLIDCITGFARPDSGSAIWRDVEICRRTPQQLAKLGVIRSFQGAQLFPALSVIENVMVGAHRKGSTGFLSAALRLPAASRDNRTMRLAAEEALDVVSCSHLATQRAAAVTTGQQRLVAIARALAAEPDLLILDEPAAGLSDAEADRLRQGLSSFICNRGMTLLVVEHHMPFVLSLCSELLVLVGGTVIAQGDCQSVSRQPEVVSAYTGRVPNVDRG